MPKTGIYNRKQFFFREFNTISYYVKLTREIKRTHGVGLPCVERAYPAASPLAWRQPVNLGSNGRAPFASFEDFQADVGAGVAFGRLIIPAIPGEQVIQALFAFMHRAVTSAINY